MVQLPDKKLVSLVPYVQLVALPAALYKICLPAAGQLVLHTALQLETSPGHHHRLHYLSFTDRELVVKQAHFKALMGWGQENPVLQGRPR